MTIDFKQTQCQMATQASRFGICDEQHDPHAKIYLAEEDKWIATVENPLGQTILFTAIDKCIEILRTDGNQDSRCDAMMTTDDLLYLVELKDKNAHWQSDGIEQLEATVLKIIESDPTWYYGFRKRKGYVANKKHPRFQVIENATMRRFFIAYKMRLDLHAEIKIE